jgi:hypothetical protein
LRTVTTKIKTDFAKLKCLVKSIESIRPNLMSKNVDDEYGCWLSTSEGAPDDIAHGPLLTPG